MAPDVLRPVSGDMTQRALSTVHYLSKEIHFNPRPFGFGKGESAGPSEAIADGIRMAGLRQAIHLGRDPIAWALDIAYDAGKPTKSRKQWECPEIVLNARLELSMALVETARIVEVHQVWLSLLETKPSSLSLSRFDYQAHDHQNIHPEFALIGRDCVVLVEMKVRGCSRHRYSANQHVKYLNLLRMVIAGSRTPRETCLVLLEPGRSPCYQFPWLIPQSSGLRTDFDALMRDQVSDSVRGRLLGPERIPDLRAIAEGTPVLVTSYESLLDSARPVLRQELPEEALALRQIELVEEHAAPRK